MEALTINKPAYTAAELKAMLQEAEQLEKKENLKARRKYEKERDNDIDNLFEEGRDLALALARYKQKCHIVMDKQRGKLDVYGGVNSRSKGGFKITNSDGTKTILRRRETKPVWDERAADGISLIKDFLLDKVKKRDRELFEILMGYIERNKEGELEYANVMKLLQHEDKFQDDNRWIKGLGLVKEGYRVDFQQYGYEFKEKDKYGKLKPLILNFSSL